MDSRASDAPSSSKAWIALGRPRSTHEWPPGPVTRTPARRLPTASTITCSRPWPSTATTASGSSSAQAAVIPAKVAEALLADGEHEGARGDLLGAEQLADDVQRDHDRSRVVADPGADQPRVVSLETKRRLGRKHGVDMRRYEEPRPSLAPRPDQIPDAVAVAAAGRVGEPLLEPVDAWALGERRRRDRGQLEQIVDQRVFHLRHVTPGRATSPSSASVASRRTQSMCDLASTEPP